MISSSRERGRRNLVSEAIRPILLQLAGQSASEAGFVVQADPCDPPKGTLPASHPDGAMPDEFAANVSLMFKRTQRARVRQMSARRSECRLTQAPSGRSR